MNWDFTCWDLSKTNVFQNFSATYHSLALWLLQTPTHARYLERNSKDTIISGFMFAIGVQKDSNFLQNFRTLQNTVSFQLLFYKRLDTHKKDKSFAPWNGKSSHWFAPGRKTHTYYHNLEVLCFARCRFCAYYQKAPGCSKACRKIMFWFHVQKRGFVALFFLLI